MELILFLVAIGASTIGAISGMGGGVIIKPVMDAVSGLDAGTISFMSCCTVLTMALSTYVRGRHDELVMDYHVSIPLALGGAAGGIAGKALFSAAEGGNAALMQAAILLAVNIGVLLYVKYKSKIETLHVHGTLPSLCIGFALGAVSSFLGIGGGPINIAVLSYFYSMSPKLNAKNSLFIILFSQITSFTLSISGGAPTVNMVALMLMCVGAVVGAIIGGKLSKRMSEDNVEMLFTIVLISLIVLGCYNVYCFSVG